MKHFFLFIIFFLAGLVSHGQKQGDFWYFQGNGLDFSSGSPLLLTNGQIPSGNGIEGTATISDSAGNLLFYANAQNIWNANHQYMSNGTGLLGGLSSTQGVFIVPKPSSDSLFYVFTLDEMENCFQNGLRYSIVNMCLDSGLGSVVSSSKNILLLDSAGEKMAATFHSNGNDIWLVVHKYFSDAFYAYLITANGISDTVISHVGAHHPADFSTDCWQGIGQMKISPDGSKLAVVNANAFTNSIKELFDFDNTTGIVSNPINLQPDSIFQYYGVAFSPDNSKLYLTKFGNPYQVYQFDLSSGNPSMIVASRTGIFSVNGPLGGLQLGPDGKIYVVSTGNPYISIIPNPNNGGLACGYIVQGINNIVPMQYSFPNFIDSYGYRNGIQHCEPLGIEENENTTLPVYPNPFYSTATFQTHVPLVDATLTIFNCFGQIVKRIDDVAGRSITFQKGNLLPGLYLFSITEGSKNISSGRFVILDK